MAAKTKAKVLKVEEVKEDGSKDDAAEEKEGINSDQENKVDVEENTQEDDKNTSSDKSKSGNDEPKISSFSQVELNKKKDILQEKDNKSKAVKETLDLTSEKTKSNDDEEKDKEETDSKDDESDNKDFLSDVKNEKSIDDIEEGGSKKKYFFIVLLIVILVGIISGGIYYYQTNMADQTEVADTEEPITNDSMLDKNADQELNEDEATESAEIDYENFSLNILNGSGVAGEAGKVSDLLTDFDTIDTGNADSYDYVETEISTKKDVDDSVYEVVESSLNEYYITTKSDTYLDEDYEYDIEIIVGSKKL